MWLFQFRIAVQVTVGASFHGSHPCVALSSSALTAPVRQPSAMDQGRGVGKDIVFAFFQPIEDALRRRLGRRLRCLEAAVHIRVDGAQDDGMDRYALSSQERSQ